jgi:glycosyltransferase involved in cell wall biosynthesis
MNIAIYWEQELWGGVDTHLLELLKGWPESNDYFTLFYNSGNPGFQRIQEELVCIPNLRSISVNSHSYNQLRWKTSRNRILSLITKPFLFVLQPLLILSMTLYLKRIISSAGNFDVFLANNGCYPGAWGCISSLFSASYLRIPSIIMLVHHCSTPKSYFFSFFRKLIDKKIQRACSFIICVSNATKESLLLNSYINENVDQFKVIHNTVKEVKDCTNIIENLFNDPHYSNKCIHVGIVGRVEPHKGHEDLLHAVSLLPKNILNICKFYIVGTGFESYLLRLKELCSMLALEDHVYFTGYINHPSQKIISQLDLLICATRDFEGFGLTLLEAITCCVPIITTNVGAILEFVNPVYSQIVPPHSPKELSLAIACFVENQKDWVAKANMAKKDYELKAVNMSVEWRELFLESTNAPSNRFILNSNRNI